MTESQQLQQMMGQKAVDRDGNKVGKIGQVYLDDATGQPQWVTVSTGLFGKKELFAPQQVSANVRKEQIDEPDADAAARCGR